jgi:hypothetical protein
MHFSLIRVNFVYDSQQIFAKIDQKPISISVTLSYGVANLLTTG